MRYEQVTMHGHRISYREAGEAGMPVLLLVHGITSSSATWDEVIPALAEHAHVIAPDLLGHGQSDKPAADYSLGALASGLRDLLEVLGHDRVTVVGHSLGGGVAMQFGYQYYQHCERMVLVSSGGRVVAAVTSRDRRALACEAAADRRPDATRAACHERDPALQLLPDVRAVLDLVSAVRRFVHFTHRDSSWVVRTTKCHRAVSGDVHREVPVREPSGTRTARPPSHKRCLAHAASVSSEPL